MSKVEVYTKNWCPFSVRAKRLLDHKGVTYEEIDVTNDPIREREMFNRSRRHVGCGVGTVQRILNDNKT